MKFNNLYKLYFYIDTLNFPISVCIPRSIINKIILKVLQSE